MHPVAAEAATDPFATSRSAFDALTLELSAEPAAGLGHAELEELLELRGRDLLRQLFQDHLDLRQLREEYAVRAHPAPVTGPDGVARRAVETGHRRLLASIFGTVTVGRCAWRAPRHARRMYNPTTSTFASHADPQGRLHGPRPPAAAPPPPRARAGVPRPSPLPPSTRPAAGQPGAAGQLACHHPHGDPPLAGHRRHHPVAPPGDRRPHAPHHHGPAPRRTSRGAGLPIPSGLLDRSGDDPTMAKHQHRQRASGAPGHGAGPARPAPAATPPDDPPALPDDPAAEGLLVGQAAGPPGRPGVRR